MPTLLVVAHAPTASCTRLLDAVVAGAHDDAIEGVMHEVATRTHPGDKKCWRDTPPSWNICSK